MVGIESLLRRLRGQHAGTETPSTAPKGPDLLKLYDSISVRVMLPLSDGQFPEEQLLGGLLTRWDGLVKGRLPRSYGAERVVLIEDDPPGVLASVRQGMVHLLTDGKAPLDRLRTVSEAVFDVAVNNKLTIGSCEVQIEGVKKQPENPVVNVAEELSRPLERLTAFFTDSPALVLGAVAPFFYITPTCDYRIRKVSMSPTAESTPGIQVELISRIPAGSASGQFMRSLGEDLDMFRDLSPTLPTTYAPALGQLWN